MHRALKYSLKNSYYHYNYKTMYNNKYFDNDFKMTVYKYIPIDKEYLNIITIVYLGPEYNYMCRRVQKCH